MKRKASPGPVPATACTKKQPRQDPVSCESCRKKKLKCDRNQPCSSCSARKLVCSYGSYGHGTLSPPVKQGSHSEESMADIRPISPLGQSSQGIIQPSGRPDRNDRNEPLITADWLETIVMGPRVHRVPPVLPPPPPHHQPPEIPQTCQPTISGHLMNIVQGVRVASNENPANIHLPSLLPSEPEALSLLAFYLNHLDYQYHLIVLSRTKRDIHAIYDSIARNEPVNLGHLALLFSIMATALFYQLLPTQSADVAEICSGETAFLAGAALIQANYIAYPTIEGLQATMIIGHHLSAHTLSPSVSSFFVHGSLVSQAKGLGLHAIDNASHREERKRNGYNKTEVELKRRLWWDIASYDWLIGFMSGPQQWTYTIHPNNMNVCRPLNIEDEDLDSSETGQPLSIPTCMSYTHSRLRLAEVCREFVDTIGPEHLHGHEVPYDKILELDRKLNTVYAELPVFFRYDQASRREYGGLYRERPAFAWQRAFIQQGYHSRLCRLHRDYFVRGARDPRYSYSHVVTLRSARKVLEVKRIMDEEEPDFIPDSSFFWAVMHHVFMAAVILLIDVCFNWDDLLAERRKQEVLDACRMLSRAQQSSSVAREGINAMMGILRKHWKQEKRPPSQPEPSSGVTAVAPFNAQSMMPTSASVYQDKSSHFSGSAQTLTLPGQGLEPVNPTAPNREMPLEDLWAEMLDVSGQAGLETPDWMNMLTELNNTTAPSPAGLSEALAAITSSVRTTMTFESNTFAPEGTSPSTQSDLQTIADRIKNGHINRIVVLVGAGISTSAGIPDFRSPNTGLYDRLAPLKLPYPEAIFHISYFSHSPEPFYAIARARHPGNLKPTISHAFLALLAKNNLLHFLFTQNIDGLEEDAGVPAEKILWAHGNWKSQHCWKCKAEYPDDLMKKAINAGDVPYCLQSECNGAIKPDVVFFGQSLPKEFDEKMKFIPEADLMLVMGTSLKVAPCSTIPRRVENGIPRVLINMEKAGDMGNRDQDVCILGPCDDGVRDFADKLGWGDELDTLFQEAVKSKAETQDYEDGIDLDECIAKMAAQMDARLGISKGHKMMLESHLSDKFARMMAKPGSS